MDKQAPCEEGVLTLENLRYNADGLIPCIVQDASTRAVLMMAWMNAESLRLTLAQGTTWFWSRSRQKLWHKGEQSGNTQALVALRYDCDGDTLLALVNPQGPACHTGHTTCFYRNF
ncbi:MAG: phosphoribosyl-AMP cyclohydrolase [Raoultibacter sp.]